MAHRRDSALSFSQTKIDGRLCTLRYFFRFGYDAIRIDEYPYLISLFLTVLLHPRPCGLPKKGCKAGFGSLRIINRFN